MQNVGKVVYDLRLISFGIRVLNGLLNAAADVCEVLQVKRRLVHNRRNIRKVSQRRSPINFISTGQPQPLGPSPLTGREKGVNFALFSQHATRVTLELYDSSNKPLQSISLERSKNRTGDIWHIAVQNLPLKGIQYGWRVGGEGGWETGHRWNEEKVLVDPYAPLVSGRKRFAIRDEVEQYKEKVIIHCYSWSCPWLSFLIFEVL